MNDQMKPGAELALRQREIAIKERVVAVREAKLQQNSDGNRRKWRDPVVLAILAAAVAALGNGVVAVINGMSQRGLESQRAEQTRILEMIKTDSPDTAADNLQFLLDAGLILDPQLNRRLSTFLNERPPGTGPVLPTLSRSPPSAVDIEAIAAGDFLPVRLSNFMNVVVSTEQVTEREMRTFLDSALEVLSQRATFSREEHWSITALGGEVHVLRTRSDEEFTRALDGLNDAVEAIRNEQDMDGIRVLVRGTTRFYDIQGLPGLNDRAWISLDLR